ncbi:AI-2E family transporter [Geobacter sp. DSM 9736]|uniref:AI-2E family transporter n=1 Tax=Geobacter sp. DSM 9736 TaxID=1277350 RepID=UPI000B5005D9|nr:AI-2E family transporter [Geobacter sp. DSM 9736]SNB45926.1 Predicted PurR-regulated permease PerM [Geobacter sp. DSM 9736]
MDRKLLFTLLVFSFTLFIIYQVYSIISPFLAPLVLAGVIGISAFPLYTRVRDRLRGRDNAAAGFMTVVVAVVCVGPVVGLAFLLSQEAARLYAHLEILAAGDNYHLLENVKRHAFVAPWLDRLTPLLGGLQIDLKGTIVTLLKGATSLVASYSGGIARNVFGFLLKLIILVIALFFVFRDGDHFQRQFWSAVPLDVSRKELMIATVKRVLSAVIYGIFLTCIVQGIMGGIGFWIAGLPAPLLFGAVMAVCALIPIVGTALVWAPGAIYLLLQGKTVMGVFLLIWGAVAVGSIDNVIRPFFISGKARLSVLVIAVGILGGVVSFGFSGVLIGPVILALFIELFKVYRAEMFPGPGGHREM